MNEQELRKLVGSRIRTEREVSGYSLGDVAGRIGLHESSLSRIERGEQAVEIVMLTRIGDVLGVRPEAFLDASRDTTVAYARTQAGARDTMVDWTLDVLADMRFAEAEVQRRGW
jgi:transcriptional regulator with XRE-family HTH domain